MQTAPVSQSTPFVLVVDDHPDVRLSFGYMLAASGFRVAEVGGVQSALTFMARHPVDVILTDIAMPDADGIALLRTIREWPRPRPRLIAYTGYAFNKTDQAHQLADAVFLKPIWRDDLVRTIEELITASGRDESGDRRI